MDITPWLVGHSVPLVEMLDGREARAIRQRRLLSEGAPVLVCFTLNMAGSVKVHPLSEETFLAGMREIRSRLELAQLAVRREEMLTPSWGWDACSISMCWIRVGTRSPVRSSAIRRAAV